jgi:excisionase family DNA binding protein
LETVLKQGRFKMADKQPDVELRAYRINDFCRAYGFSRTTVYKLIAAGTLRTVLVGGRRLVPRDAAEALLSQGATDGKAA